MEYKIVIDGIFYGSKRTLPDLNDYLHQCGRHPQAGGRLKKEYQRIVSVFIRQQLKHLTIDKPIVVHYTFYEADKQRDKGNIFSFADKIFCDALQECGVIKNDGWAQIENFTQEFYVDKKHPRIEITIEEVGV